MKDFGKLNFSTSFRPTSAFPLDARSVFGDLESAKAAAKTAGEIGSTDSIYYYGMQILVSNSEGETWYTIQRDGTLSEIGGSSVSETEIKEQLNKFVTIGNKEPTDGPGFWFDTVNPVEDFPVILQVGDVGKDDDIVIVNVIE